MIKKTPTWFECNLMMADSDDLDGLLSDNELLLDSNTRNAYFYKVPVKLEAQEYKFLKAVLNRHGNRISCEKVMKQIKSTCKPELAKNLSYKIKSRIKGKFKKEFYRMYADEKVLCDPNNDNWYVYDREWQTNFCIKYNTKIPYQKIPFSVAFDMLLSVDGGEYQTNFMRK